MDLQQLLTNAAALSTGGAPGMGSALGGSLDAVDDLKKALQASDYQSDVATLSGGGALGVQSLDPVMKAVIQDNDHFVLFDQLQSTNAINIVDEYTRQTGVGGFLGGSTNTQMGVVRSAQGEYAREVGLVKFLMTLRQVGYVLNLGKNIVEPMAAEERSGALQLLTDAEYLLFNGNAAACPTQYDGVFAIIDREIAAGNMSSDHVIDMQAAALTTVEPFTQLQATVSSYGSWGKITDAYLPAQAQQDLNAHLDPAYRWSSSPNAPITVGARIEGIGLPDGSILKPHIDTFLPYEDFPMAKPFELTWPDIATANVGFIPASITVDAATSDASSQFTAGRAGNYYYAVAAIGGQGQGYTAVVKSSQTAVAAGKKAVLTITKSTAGTETGYAIYRSRQDGTNATSDFRLMAIVAKAGDTTTFTDLNRKIPGTIRIPCLAMAPSADAIGWRQFQPMTKIPLPFGVGGVPVMSWFQFLFGYLRMTKPKHHGYIDNVLPTSAKWKPFTA